MTDKTDSLKRCGCNSWDDCNCKPCDPFPPEPCNPGCSPDHIREILESICDLKEQIAACENVLIKIGRAIFSNTFGLSEIKAEVSFIESTVTDINNQITSGTFGLSEIKSEVSFIESTVTNINNQITSTTFGLQEIKSEVSAILGMMEEQNGAALLGRTTGPIRISTLLESALEVKAYNVTNTPQSVTFVVREFSTCPGNIIDTIALTNISPCCVDFGISFFDPDLVTNIAINALPSTDSGLYLYAATINNVAPTFPKVTEVLAEQWLPLATFCL